MGGGGGGGGLKANGTHSPKAWKQIPSAILPHSGAYSSSHAQPALNSGEGGGDISSTQTSQQPSRVHSVQACVCMPACMCACVSSCMRGSACAHKNGRWERGMKQQTDSTAHCLTTANCPKSTDLKRTAHRSQRKAMTKEGPDSSPACCPACSPVSWPPVAAQGLPVLLLLLPTTVPQRSASSSASASNCATSYACNIMHVQHQPRAREDMRNIMHAQHQPQRSASDTAPASICGKGKILLAQ